jgi:hypothetical protein
MLANILICINDFTIYPKQTDLPVEREERKFVNGMKK